MTAPAAIKQAELRRMATIAKKEGVRVGCEVNGKIFWVTPDIPDNHKAAQVDLEPEDFVSLSEWQAWRDQERAREAQRHS